MPKVAVIIPHYSEDKRYLNLCLESLLSQSHENLDIYVSSSSQIKPEVPIGVKLIQHSERMHYAKAINTGTRAALTMSESKPEYVIWGNDDTIYGRHSVEELVKTSKTVKDLFLINPLSNCDQTRLYIDEKMFGLPIQCSHDELTLQMKNEIREDFYASSFFFFPVPKLAFYSTLVPVSVIERVGVLDEKFLTAGFEDDDYCVRCNKAGVYMGVTRSSFVFHFSGASTKDKMTNEERQYNMDYFQSKYNAAKL